MNPSPLELAYHTTAAICDLKVPLEVMVLQLFLGVLNVHGHFVSYLAQIAGPLNAKMKRENRNHLNHVD